MSRRISPWFALFLAMVVTLPAAARPRNDEHGGQRAERHEQRHEDGGRRHHPRTADRLYRHDDGHPSPRSHVAPRSGRHYGRGHDARAWAADAARRHTRGGRVLSAEPSGEERYRVRVLTPDGYIRNLTVDPYAQD